MLIKYKSVNKNLQKICLNITENKTVGHESGNVDDFISAR